MMTRIDVPRFGLAWGVTAAILYLGCALIMTLAGKKALVFFFNSLLHGIDVTTILRLDMPVGEMAVGIVEIFILSWLTGAAIAGIYNFSLERSRND